MKLTLRVSGGFTGLAKEYTVDIEKLSKQVRDELITYFETNSSKKPANLNKSWILDDKKTVSVDPNSLPKELQELYEKMVRDLKYKQR